MYEFKEQENVIIRKLYKQMTFVGSCLVFLGVIFTVIFLIWLIGEAHIIKTLFAAVLSVILLTMGIITIMSSNHFKKVVITEGEDIQHLMIAIDKLTTWFSIQTIMILISIAVVILGFVASIAG